MLCFAVRIFFADLQINLHVLCGSAEMIFSHTYTYTDTKSNHQGIADNKNTDLITTQSRARNFEYISAGVI